MKSTIFNARKATLVICLFAPLVLHAEEKSAEEIIKLHDQKNRAMFNTALIKAQLATCRFTIKDNVIACVEKPRISVMEAVEKKRGIDLKDSESLVQMQQPVSDKGVGMLTYEHHDSNKDNDILLYLPALGKTRRIVSGGSGNEDGGSFFGSEFYVDDTQYKKIEMYTYKNLRDDVFEGRPVWVLDSTPNAKRAKRTQYGKAHLWIDKERKLIVREDIFNKAGKLYRQRVNSQFTLVDGVWLAKRQVMKNLLTKRMTVLTSLSAAYNREVPEAVLSERSLTDLTFRARAIEAMRGQTERGRR